jgi:hypothetical protein
MHVGVVLEVLAPGMEHGEEADLSPAVRGVGGDLLQGLGGGAEQEAVDHPLILQGDRAEHRRQSKHDMKIFNRQQLRFAGLHPHRRGGGLALGTVAVPARVVRDLLIPAPVTSLDVPAQGGGPAVHDVAQGAALLG